MTWRPCTVCGEPCDGYRCDEHTPPPPPKRSKDERGYDWTWVNLSRRARKLQPFCTDCQTTDDLTADHLPIAWERKLSGKTIRLCDVEVVCRSCNSKRGQARPGGLGSTTR